MSPYESVYAVVIVVVVFLFSLAACVSLRIFRRRRLEKQEIEPGQNIQLAGVLDSVSQEAIRTVLNWQQTYPPITARYVENDPLIVKRGVKAWMFVEPDTSLQAYESNAAVMDPCTVMFCQGQGSIMTNLPVPSQELSYWEVKVLQLDKNDVLAIGLATRPYPCWRMPGWHNHSIAYHSDSGHLYVSNLTSARPYASSIKQGDVVGVGYLYQSGTVFFTKNGQNLGKALIGFKYPVHPIVGASGPCHVTANFGEEDYLFSAANQREAAFGPKQASMLPPPAYGGHTEDTMLFDGAQDEEHLTYANDPPGYS